jgi:predicted RNase H-like HicB family nuclease
MPVTLTIDVERETDGRWLAEVPELPGVLAYGATESAAVIAAEVIALRVLADRLERSGDDRLVALTFTRATS